MRALSLMLGLLFLGQTKPDTSTPDLSTPEKTIRYFLPAYLAGQLKKAGQCVEGFRPDSRLGTFEQELQASHSATSFDATITDVTVHIEGDQATAMVMSVLPVPKTKAMEEQITLKRNGQEWKIVPWDRSVLDTFIRTAPKQDKTHSFPLVNFAATMLCNLPYLYDSREKAVEVTCQFNLKQVTLGGMMYLLDQEDIYKLKAADYKAKVLPYTKTEVCFHCPADRPGRTSYSFNSNLSGFARGNIRYRDTVFLYEGSNGVLTFRHKGKAAVAFVDGSIKMVDAVEAKKLHWKP